MTHVTQFTWSRTTSLLIAFLLMLMLVDCNCQRRQIVVKSVLLDIPVNVAGFSSKLDREKFSDLVQSVIEKEPYFKLDRGRDDGEILRLAVIVPPELKRDSPILIMASISVQNDEAPITKAFADIKVIDGRISGKDVSASVAKVLQNLYHHRSGIMGDSTDYLTKIERAVSGENPAAEELINAISIMGEAREKKAVEPLISLLGKTESLSIGNACLVALGELEDKRAMSAIIDFTERKPPIIRRQAIIAARKIASQEAAEWLLVMAYGYDDPVVRSEALVALGDVETKLGLNKE